MWCGLSTASGQLHLHGRLKSVLLYLPQRKYHLTKLPDSLHYAGLSSCNTISKRWSLGQHTWWDFHGRDIDVMYLCGRRQMLRLLKVASLKLGQNTLGKYIAHGRSNIDQTQEFFFSAYLSKCHIGISECFLCGHHHYFS